MKLKSLSLENFESWESGFFEFHPGVNIFVGLSDTGKSAVLRALRLLMENKPTGDEYRSDFADKKAITKIQGNFTEAITHYPPPAKFLKIPVNAPVIDGPAAALARYVVNAFKFDAAGLPLSSINFFAY